MAQERARLANKSWLKKGHDGQTSHGSRKDTADTIGKQVIAQERAHGSRKGTIGKQVIAPERARLANKSNSSRKGTIGKQVM